MRNLTMAQALVYATELAITMATAVVIGVLVGRWADDRLGNAIPILTMVGALLGLASGVYSMVKLARVMPRPKSGSQ